MSSPHGRIGRPMSRPFRPAWRPLVGIVATVAACSGMPAQARGQERVQPGQRVRVSLDCPGTVAPGPSACRADGRETGVLVRLGPDDLVLETSDSVVTHPLASITRLEASLGSSSRWKEGGLIGFVAGTALTFAVLQNAGSSSASTNPCDPGSNQDAIGGTGTCLILAGVVGGLPGALIGGFVGSRFRAERWEAVPLGAVGLTIMPIGSRPYVGVSVRLP